jgi:hypothetical protein
LALVEGDGQIQCFLLDDNDDDDYGPTAKRRLFSFEAPELMARGIGDSARKPAPIFGITWP